MGSVANRRVQAESISGLGYFVMIILPLLAVIESLASLVSLRERNK
jgi:hypothetical protein